MCCSSFHSFSLLLVSQVLSSLKRLCHTLVKWLLLLLHKMYSWCCLVSNPALGLGEVECVRSCRVRLGGSTCSVPSLCSRSNKLKSATFGVFSQLHFFLSFLNHILLLVELFFPPFILSFHYLLQAFFLSLCLFFSILLFVFLFSTLILCFSRYLLSSLFI